RLGVVHVHDARTVQFPAARLDDAALRSMAWLERARNRPAYDPGITPRRLVALGSVPGRQHLRHFQQVLGGRQKHIPANDMTLPGEGGAGSSHRLGMTNSKISSGLASHLSVRSRAPSLVPMRNSVLKMADQMSALAHKWTFAVQYVMS